MNLANVFIRILETQLCFSCNDGLSSCILSSVAWAYAYRNTIGGYSAAHVQGDKVIV